MHQAVAACWILICALLLQGCGGAGDSAGTHMPNGALSRMTSADPGVAVFPQGRARYRIKQDASGYVVTPLDTWEGVRSLANVHTLVFADMSINLRAGELALTIPRADLNRIIELYIAFFNRVPDAEGLGFWIAALRNGKTIDEIADSFYVAAVQYSALTGYSTGMTHADFVRVVYKNVLGRDTVDEQGLAFWAERLRTGTTRGTLVSTILGSAHTFKDDATFGWVANLLDNKLYVGHYFAVQQGVTYRSPEESISRTMNIAAMVTPTDVFAATNLISPDPGFNLLPLAAFTNDNGLTLTPVPLIAESWQGENTQLSLQATLNREFPGANYVAVIDYGGILNGQISLSYSSQTAVNLGMGVSAALAPGMHEGFFEIRVCLDDPLVCSLPQPGSPWYVPYRLIVKSQTLLYKGPDFTGTSVEGATFDFPSRRLDLDTGMSAPDYSVAYDYGEQPGWLMVGYSKGMLQLKANTTGLTPGLHTAKLRVGSLHNQVEQTVTIFVSSAFTAPSSLSLTIGNGAANTVAALSMAGTIGAPSQLNWVVTSDQPWLIVDTPAGATGEGNLRVHVDPAAVASLGNNTTHRATLTLSDPSGKLVPVRVPVDITMAVPELQGTAPFHLIRGESETIRLRGHNLNQLDLSTLRMGGLAVQTPTLVDARTISFTPPSNLGVGTYALTAAGRIAGSVNIPVINYAGAHALNFMPGGEEELQKTRRMVFDDGRDTLYGSNYLGVARYKHTGGSWTRTWRSIPGEVHSMALSPDRKYLAVATSSTLYLLDAETFSVSHVAAYATAPHPRTYDDGPEQSSLAFAPDGRLYLSHMVDAFDMATRKFVVGDIGFYGGALLPNVFGNQLNVNGPMEPYRKRRMRAGELELTPLPDYECGAGNMGTSRYGNVTACGLLMFNDAGPLGSIPRDNDIGWPESWLVAPDGATAYAVHPAAGLVNAYVFAGGLRKVKSVFIERLQSGGWDMYATTISQDGLTLFVSNRWGMHIIPVSALTAVN